MSMDISEPNELDFANQRITDLEKLVSETKIRATENYNRSIELTKELERVKADANSYLRHIDSLHITVARLSGYIDRIKEIEGRVNPIQSNANVVMQEMPRGYHPDSDRRNY